MKNLIKIFVLTAAFALIFGTTAFAASQTFSEFWYQTSDGEWHVKDETGNKITNCWLCDDAVASNGQNIWYLIDGNGNMISAPLVQDGTGNKYSLEHSHNGYYGMLHYQDKAYDYDGESITLDVESSHNGSFAAIQNDAGIEALKAKYGLTTVSIDNSNIVYTSTFKANADSSTSSSEVGPGTGSTSGKSGTADLANNRFTFDGKDYVLDYDWGAHYVSGYAPTGNKTASGTVPVAGRTLSGPSYLKGKVCYIKGISGSLGSKYDGVYKFEDTGGSVVEYGASHTMGVPVVDIFCDTVEEARSITASDWTTVEVYILKEK